MTEIIPTRSRAHAKSSEVPAGFFEKSADEQLVTRDLSKHRSPVFQRALVVYRRRVAAFVVHSGR